jgi:hypothetical protein
MKVLDPERRSDRVTQTARVEGKDLGRFEVIRTEELITDRRHLGFRQSG